MWISLKRCGWQRVSRCSRQQWIRMGNEGEEIEGGEVPQNRTPAMSVRDEIGVLSKGIEAAAP
jgi:hypothetical protein